MKGYRKLRAVGLVSCAVVLVGVLIGASPNSSAVGAGANVVINPSLETLVNGKPSCFATYGYGTSTLTTTQITTVAGSHTGTHAVSETLAGYVSGDWKLMPIQSAACAPTVTAGDSYTASVWYKSTTAAVSLTEFAFTPATGWKYYKELKVGVPVSAAWAQVSVVTPVVPVGVTQVSFGLSLYGNGTVTTDDYSLVDNTVTTTPPTTTPPTTTPPPPPPGCTGTAVQCAQGQWTVLSFPNHVRSVHSIVLNTGKILFMAGSGNQPTMTQFKTTVWDPRDNTWTDIYTPTDVFCSGHVQLPNGNVLILGGNAAYPVTGVHGYEGLKAAYIFNTATMTYQRINDMNTGHWYPSATELGNGNVFAMGGLNENGAGTVTNEEFNNTTGQMMATNTLPQQYNYFGLYPANILTAAGGLFYSGSHVFGNSPTPGGAEMINLAANTITAVPGLQDINNRDQSAAVLLPPAQAQRVMVLGGGNVNTNVDANRDTDIIDLTAANPTYAAGPLLPQGTMEMGNDASMTMTDPTVTPETGAQGKMYVSAVLLPDRTVLETGGGLHNRADAVYEASSYNPGTNTFTPMAVDPVERMYHSESILYQDGTVISVGSNPGNGTFDLRISVYKPPYLFHTGLPTVNAPAVNQWAYGSTQSLTGSDGITSAELLKPAAVTHSSDPNQRLVDLPLTKTGTGTYTVAMTGNSNIAPPGWYMLFVQNANGPSTAQWVHVG